MNAEENRTAETQTDEARAANEDPEGRKARKGKTPPIRKERYSWFHFFAPYRKTVQSDGIRLGKIILSTFLFAISMNFFLDAMGLLPAGFNGLSFLIQRIGSQYFGIHVHFAVLNIALNAIPAILAFFRVGKRFVIYSVVHIVVYSFLIDWIPHFQLTDDILLNVIFGAVIHGIGQGIALNANASTGGTDFIAMMISNRFNISTWNYMMIFNMGILVVSGFLFGWRAAMYSVCFQFLSTQVVNRLHSRYQKKTVFLVCSDTPELEKKLMQETHHGITRFEGVGSYSGKKRTMLYMVVSKTDLPAIRRICKESEQEIFMNITTSDQLAGRFYLRPLD